MSSAHLVETVTGVRHWTENLFSFTTSRSPSFRFRNGQFTMLGLEIDGRPLMRAYSLASANYDDALEFFSIKVANGPLTSRLQHLKVGDRILVGRKPTGTLVLDNLSPGRRLLLLSTGTGLAPFVSIVKDPETYERFEEVILVHGCRHVAELAYGEDVVARVIGDEVIGEMARSKLIHYPTVTREPFRNRGRITDLITSAKLFEDIGRPPLDLATDRVMLCGSPEMVGEIKGLLVGSGFCEGSGQSAGEFVLEKAFVDR
jgi:ferredoxin--NADP+ reductase